MGKHAPEKAVEPAGESIQANAKFQGPNQDDAIDALWKGAQLQFIYLVDIAENYESNPFDTSSMMRYTLKLSKKVRKQIKESLHQLLTHGSMTQAPYHLKAAESGLLQFEAYASLVLDEYKDELRDNIPQANIGQRFLTLLREVGENADRASVLEGHSEFEFTGGCVAEKVAA